MVGNYDQEQIATSMDFNERLEPRLGRELEIKDVRRRRGQVKRR